jgi:phosphoenolpyruvate-protein kinase (PTS system EI component)
MSSAYAVRTASSGAAVAPAWSPRRGPGPETDAAVSASPEQVRSAFAATAAELEEMAARHRAENATAYADILDTEALIARDPTFAEEVVRLLSELDAGSAVGRVTERLAAAMTALDSAELRERAGDIRQVGRAVADRLAGRLDPPAPDGAVVLLAEEVGAPDLLRYAEQVVAAVSGLGGPSSHAAIVARSLGIPFVVGAPDELLDAVDGVRLLVDADTDAAEVVVDPAEERVARSVSAPADPGAVQALRSLPTRTTDGVDVSVLANVASAVEARRALAAGAAGVGLLRTELAHLAATDWPSRAEHERALRPVLDVLVGRPVTVRLLDFTNDKTPPFLVGRTSTASSLDLLLAEPGALDAQLDAVLDAGRDVDLRLLVPMVATPEQLVAVRRQTAAAAARAGLGVPLVGAMLETPAAVEAVPLLAAAADFFSLGTNDLTVATLGVGRTDESVGPAQTAHPDVLRLVEDAVHAAGAAGRPISVCGDAAADPDVLPLLLGAGLTTVSVAPSRLDQVRGLVRATSVAESGQRLAGLLGAQAGVSGG